MNAVPSIDFAGVVARADLRTILEADLGPTKVIGGKPHWHCPFHADGNPSLYLFDGGRRWRCWPCGLIGDVLDYLARRDGIDVVEAAKLLEPLAGGAPRPRRPRARPRPAPPPEKAPAWHDPTWQAVVTELVDQAEAILWGAEGRPFLGWLRGRGLDDGTIRRFRLGALPAEGWTAPVHWPDGTVGGLHHGRGILLPWIAPGAGHATGDDAADGPRWCGANVRRLMPDVAEPWPGPDKCRALKGSERGHLYPWADVLPAQGFPPALIVEGEIDALVGFQEAGWLALAGTVGGATQTPRPSALAALALCPWWLIATDHDEAGVEAARSWRERAPHKARRVLLPHGKDLSDFHTAGGNVAEWLAGELARVGIAGPISAEEAS